LFAEKVSTSAKFPTWYIVWLDLNNNVYITLQDTKWARKKAVL